MIKKIHLIILSLIILTHIHLLSNIVFFPYPELFVYSYLTNQGLIPYKQIFDQHFPGLMFFPINLVTMGIDTPFEAHLVNLSIVSLNQVLIFLLAKRIFKSDIKALFCNFLYLVWHPFYEGYVLWIEVFVTPLLLLSSYFLLGGKVSRLRMFILGFLLGITLLLKQVVLPTILLLIIYFWLTAKNKFNKTWYFLLGISLPLAYLLFWIWTNAIWSEFFFWTIKFNLTTFPEMGKKLPDIFGLLKIFPIFGLVFVSPFFFRVYFGNYQIKVVYLFFVGALFFAFARFDFIHLQPALPFAILVFVYSLSFFEFRKVFTFIFLFVFATVYLLLPFYKSSWGKGFLFFGEFERKLSKKVLSYVVRGDVIFTIGTTPHIYYLTQTLPPGKLFVFQFPWFMKVAEEDILWGIINNPPKLVVRDKYAEVQGIRLIDYMPNIANFVEKNYRVVDRIDNVEILVKK